MRALTLGAGVTGAVLLLASAASAAGFLMPSSTLGAATAIVPACTPVLATSSPYTLDAAGVVTHVRVALPAASNAACQTGTVLVSLRSAAGTSVGSGTLAVTATSCPSSSCTVPISGAPGLDAVRATHLLVAGT